MIKFPILIIFCTSALFYFGFELFDGTQNMGQSDSVTTDHSSLTEDNLPQNDGKIVSDQTDLVGRSVIAPFWVAFLKKTFMLLASSSGLMCVGFEFIDSFFIDHQIQFPIAGPNPVLDNGAIAPAVFFAEGAGPGSLAGINEAAQEENRRLAAQFVPFDPNNIWITRTAYAILTGSVSLTVGCIIALLWINYQERNMPYIIVANKLRMRVSDRLINNTSGGQSEASFISEVVLPVESNFAVSTSDCWFLIDPTLAFDLIQILSSIAPW